MKIKLAILEKDANYLNRMVSVFGTKYADKLEVYSFTDPTIALSAVASERLDVLVASDAFEIDTDKLPKRCAFAYFVNSAGIETVAGQSAICKFQKAEQIYKQILSLYAEKASNVSGIRLDNESCSVIAFLSAAGGAGSSSMAAACAVHYAAQGKKTLYLNFEKYGTADQYFSGEGQFDLSDVIFSLKSKKANLTLKLESCVRQDQRGVYFYAGTKVALDMMELTADEKLALLTELKLTGAYDYIVLDVDFGLDKDTLKLLRRLNAVVMVSDGSETGNSKTARACAALNILDQNADAPLMRRMYLMYNQFSNKTGSALTGLEIKELGGAPRYQHASVNEVINALSALAVFDTIQ